MEFFKKLSSKNSMAISKIYFMEYSIAMKNKQHVEFFETKSSFKDSTAFEEIYLMEYSMAMQKKYYMEFFHGIKFQGLHDQLQILPHGVLHYNAKKKAYGVLQKKCFTSRSTPLVCIKMTFGALKKNHEVAKTV